MLNQSEELPPKKFKSPRLTFYLVLLAVLATLAAVYLPQVMMNVTARLVMLHPAKSLVFAPHPAICDIGTERIQSMNPAEKIELARFVGETLAKGPSEIARVAEGTWAIRVLASQISLENQADRPAADWAEACAFESLKALGSAASEVIPLLLAPDVIGKFQGGRVEQAILAVAGQNSAPALSAFNAILSSKTSTPAQKLLVATLLQELATRSKLNSEGSGVALLTALSLFKDAPSESPQEQSAMALSMRFISSEIGLSAKFSSTKPISDFLLNPEISVSKRIGLIRSLRGTGVFHTDGGRDILSLLALDVNPDISGEVAREVAALVPRNQKEIDRLVESNAKLFAKIDLAQTPSDWEKLEKISQQVAALASANPYTALSTSGATQPGAKLDYSKLAAQVIGVLKQVAVQVGFQTKIFKSISDQAMRSPLASHFVQFWTDLLEQNNEKVMALTNLMLIEPWPLSTTQEIARQIRNGTDEERRTILNLLTQAPDYSRGSQLQKKYQPDLLNTVFDLLGDQPNKTKDVTKPQLDNLVTQLAYRFLYQGGERMLPFIAAELKKKTQNNEKKLGLLRLQAAFSSTATSMKALNSALTATPSCSLGFVLGFSDLIRRRPDSKPGSALLTDKSVDPASQGASLLPRPPQPIFVENGIPMVTAVVDPPSDRLLLKYLDCPQDYLSSWTIHSLGKHSEALKSRIIKHAESSSSAKKEFLLKALESPSGGYESAEAIDQDH